MGDGWFPFLEAFYCWVDSTAAQVGGFGLFLVWVCLLLYVLATTADMYFAPATVQLSDWLGLRPRVAGVTLLALGNGAPDVFSVLAAYRAGQGDLAVGALGACPLRTPRRLSLSLSLARAPSRACCHVTDAGIRIAWVLQSAGRCS